MSQSNFKNDYPIFRPPWWLKNNHFQSIYGTLFKYKSKQKITWQYFDLSDGDFLDIAWAGKENNPIMLVLHGLEGSVNSSYMQMTIDHLLENNYQVAVMHFRSCSFRMNKSHKTYNAGDISDLTEVIEFIYKKHQKPINLLGFSLGANVILRYLEVNNLDLKVNKAVAVSVPYDLSKSVDKLSNFYHRQFLKTLKKKVLFKAIKQKVLNKIDLNYLRSIDNLRQFDDYITAPTYGFLNAEEYYLSSSIRKDLKQIKHQTLIIHALDDPFIPDFTVPKFHELSDSTKMILTEKGGHVGFIEKGNPWQRRVWFYQLINSFLLQ